MPKETRSPLKAKPLRHAGQSLEEERRDLLLDKVFVHFLLAVVLSAFAALEWFRYYLKSPPNPLPISIAALAVIAFTGWRIWRFRPRLRALRQGIDGEKVVGQFLERLREAGYQVFHDVMGPDFNVDHVLIGPAGIFTIETKTWSKPAKGDARIRYDAEQLTAGGAKPDRNPITQARAQASWIRGLLAESTGRTFSVMPVVVFPGWFVEPPANRPQGLWVLEPKALPSFLENEPDRMGPEDVKLASFHLSRFIRSEEKRRST